MLRAAVSTRSLNTRQMMGSYTRLVSTQPSKPSQSPPEAKETKDTSVDPSAKLEKSQAQADLELKQKLEAISGGGGEAGLELENGEPVAMKRGVKQNMFRLI